ncbi:MAG TPA: YdaS family helix-turn-helix protein [Burkholderiales bacterium]|nr:YdaS family helix-turn-helix protein [Burkholderiales bacterium]
MDVNPLARAIEIVGLSTLAQKLGVTYQAIRKWQRRGRMPRTEWTGETNYAGTIEQLTDGRVTKISLLAEWSESSSPATAVAA